MPIVNVSCTTCAIRSCSMLNHCPSNWIKYIDELKNCLSYKKGQQFIYEGTPMEHIYFVYDGVVELFKVGSDNKEQIVEFAKPGDIIGHNALGGEYKYPIGAITVTEAKICQIEVDKFMKVLHAVPELSFQLMLFFAEKLRIAETRIKKLLQMTVKEKIVDALLMYNNVFIYFTAQDGYIDCPRQTLSNIAGTPIEQVSRYLSELKNDQLIEIQNRKIKIPSVSKLSKTISLYAS